MSIHAKEPWQVGVVLVSDYNTTAILDCDGDEICNMRTSLLDADANARRIVACVNATRHLSTKQLEAGDLDYAGCSTLADIRAALGVGDKPMLNELAGIVGTMKRERDEAVELVESSNKMSDAIHAFCSDCDGECDNCDFCDVAISGDEYRHKQDALAKREGNKS